MEQEEIEQSERDRFLNPEVVLIKRIADDFINKMETSHSLTEAQESLAAVQQSILPSESLHTDDSNADLVI